MAAGRLSLAAGALALIAAFAAAAAVRCLSPGEARCSIAGLFGERPRLDVPYAATRHEVVAAMLEMAGVGPGDHVVDLGTGDGRILIAAARERRARGLGVDIDPAMVRQARARARRAGVSDRVRFEVRDLFATPLGDADVVTMYLLPEVNLRLRPRLLAELRPGARLVSHSFDMGDWRPDASGRVGGSRIHMWVVPARVEGRWRLEGGGEILARQHFQEIELRRPGSEIVSGRGRLSGDRIRLTLDGRDLEGRARGDAIEGPDWRWVRASGTFRSPPQSPAASEQRRPP